MKKVCLILGAGASIEFGAPSTEVLTTLIEKCLEDDKWVQDKNAFATYQFIKGKLQKFLVKPGTLHFEHIYHCVHELLKFSYEVSEEAFDEFRYLLQPFLSLIEKNDLLAEDKLRCLEQRYIQFIYEVISKSCETPKRPIGPLRKFIKTLTESNVLRIYNLNYDDFCFQAGSSLYTGFEKNKVGRFLRESFLALQRFHTVINPVIEPAESKALASGGADVWNIFRMKYRRSLMPLARFLMSPMATFPASTRALEIGCLA